MILKVLVALGLLSVFSLLAYQAWKITVQWRGAKQAKAFYGGFVLLIAGLYLISLCSNGGVIQLQCDSQRCVLERQNIFNTVVNQEKILLASIVGAESQHKRSRYGINYYWVINTASGNKVISSGTESDVWLHAISFQEFLKNKSEGFFYRQDFRWQNVNGVAAGLLMAILGTLMVCKVATSKEHF